MSSPPPPASATTAGAAAGARADESVVGPLERGLAVLRVMAGPGNHRLRPSDLVHVTGLARSTVDRVVGTLLHLDYLRPAGRDVELTPRVMEFGNAYLTACGIPGALGPLARDLADELNESVSVAVPDGDGVRFVVQVPRRRTMVPTFRVGDLLPGERCAPGALFAAEWSEAERAAWRERLRSAPEAAPGAEEDFARRAAAAAADGWSVDDQMIERGLIAVAVPVRGPSGRTACAVSVVSHTSRHTADSLREACLPRLRALQPAMERALADAAPGRQAPGGAAPAGPGSGPAPQGAPAPAPGGPDPGRAAKQELGAGFLQSLARGLSVLVALGGAPGGRTLSETAEAAGLPRATARRCLITLEQLGYAESRGDAAGGRRFAPRPRVLDLGYTRMSRLDVTDIAQPHLERLAARVRESASMAVLDGDDIRYVARVPTYRIMSVDITVGTRFPAYATSMGRVLLAGLPPGERAARLAAAGPRPLTRHTVTDPAALERALEETAARGYALVDEELEEGLRAIAVPLRDREGRTLAALNVSTHTGRAATAEQSLAALLPPLTETAAWIEADLRVVSRWAAPRLP